METDTHSADSFDIGSFDALTKAQDDGIDVPIVHPVTREPIGLTIRVAGPDSERQRAARRMITNARLQTRSMKLPTAEELEEVAADEVIEQDKSERNDFLEPVEINL